MYFVSPEEPAPSAASPFEGRAYGAAASRAIREDRRFWRGPGPPPSLIANFAPPRRGNLRRRGEEQCDGSAVVFELSRGANGLH